jgi:hypothetical protein
LAGADLPATRSSATVRFADFDRVFSKDGSMRLCGVILRGMKGPDSVSGRSQAGSAPRQIETARNIRCLT